MNRLLARMVDVLNRLLAALFLVGGPIVGATIGATFGDYFGSHVVQEAVLGLVVLGLAVLGFLVGLVAGAFLAVVVCGLLALIVPIHDTLNNIHRLLGEATADTANRDPASDPDSVSPHRL